MEQAAKKVKYCPLCGKDNNCSNVAGKPHGTCWCSQAFFPKAIFDLIPNEQRNKSCICQDCLEKFTIAGSANTTAIVSKH